jgi:3'-phosphoadenosine 5'-phosphosulfate sulfotransferase (PAPS reductase)/FAD synthetase
MKTVVYLSGGKDSTATLLLALKERDDVVAVFNDTGWEHPITYGYLDYLQTRLNIKIQRTQGDIIELIRSYKKFPFGMGRFCTSGAKVSAMYKWYKSQGYYKDGQAESWLGIRLDESVQRGKKYKGMVNDETHNYREIYPSCPKSLADHVRLRFPIIDWSTEDVFQFLKDEGVSYNPLYDEGTNDRVGCYPCLLAGKKVQQRMFATPLGQQRLQIIRQLEQEIGQKYEMFDTDQGSCEACKI